MKILIKNAKICYSDRIERGNILTKNDKIIQISSELSDLDNDTTIIDANGLYALPGMIDIHTHLDNKIGHYQLADDYYSGSKMAIQTGVTTLFSFITEERDCSLQNSIMLERMKADNHCLCDYHWHITPTSFSLEDFNVMERLIDQGFKTFKLYTTYRQAGIYCDYKTIDKIAYFLKMYNAKLLIHCEDEEVILNNRQNYKYPNDAKSHAHVRPEMAELIAVSRMIEISKKHQIPVHIVHVSSFKSIEMINQAKIEAPITCETCPQYLFLNDELLNQIHGYRYICSPPLRMELIRGRLEDCALRELIDCYATDHCAFHAEDKDAFLHDFRKVPNGLPGIGALTSLIYELYKNQGDRAYSLMAKHLSENPAKLTGIFPAKGVLQKGSDADIVLVNQGTLRPIVSSLSDAYNPYDFLNTNFNVVYTIKAGQIVVKDNTLINEIYGNELNRIN